MSSRPIVQVARGVTASTLLASSRGTPLPSAERSYFEGMLQHDFSQVRVHTGEAPAAAASALGAKAFTQGSEIGFGAGRYSPGTPDGRELLAHELVHVAQQARGGSGGGAEARASDAASRVARGEAVTPQAQGGAEPGAHCDPDDEKKAVPPLDRGPQLVPPLTLQPPLAPPYRLMQNADLLAPFTLHGATPATAGFNPLEDWARAYQLFRGYLPEGLAAASANLSLSAAYQSSLALSQPNIFDKADLDFKAAYPNDKRIDPVPLISSSSLTSIYEFFTKKKNTNKFYFGP